jgi:anaerobic selenocysteine-containing dehydrogenase
MSAEPVHDDVWIPTVCANCFSFCPIKAHRVNGVVVKIEGNPDDPLTKGRICARGLSGINQLYDPNRLDYPLKRTNPRKGRGIDPKWQRITWEEALDTIAAKLREVREDDPRKLVASFGVNGGPVSYTLEAFAVAFGTPNIFVGGAGNHCASGKHFIGGLTHAAWVSQPDFNYCNYFLNFGVPVGTGAYYGVNTAVRKMAEARSRGMKHVVFDPWMGMPAQSADEWVPIIPGTDAVVALAMVNLLLNELDIYDKEYLEHETNGPYLVGEDGHYIRTEDGKPQMWDSADKALKPYDGEFKHIALEVDQVIEGRRYRSAFTVIKEHVKSYTPESAEAISTVPAQTIRRLAREFATEARIGETIVIDGHELPFRPVALGYFKGPQAHRHSALTCTALELLGAVAGVRSVPGSYIGINSRSLGHPETGFPKWSPHDGPDGLLVTGRWVVPPSQPWPPVFPKKPDDLGLGQLIPPSHGNTPMLPLVAQNPDKYGIDYKPRMQIIVATNFAMSLSDPDEVEGFFSDVFTVNFNIFLDETAELSDIVLPDASYLERLDINADWMANGCATDAWSYPLRQPVVPPIAERRSSSSVLLDLAGRVGIAPDMNAVINVSFGFREPYLLDLDRTYSLEELVDHRYKSWFGEQFGLDYMRKHGILAWPKRVDEVYWHPFVKTRIPIYFEHFLTFRETLEQIQQETGLFLELDLGDFQPYPDWRPCMSHTEGRPEFDLTAVYFRLPFESFTMTGDNAWLDEVATIDSYANRININAATAAGKGIKEGDWIELESAGNGKKVRGKARVTQCVHPAVVAMSGHGGHWAKGLPLASQAGKGINFNRLLKQDFEHMDTLSLNLDLCVKVKVTKVTGP